ncbi:MAG TPA: RNase adapter RapZ [Candidatus Ignatzschineria merdigallinarum]|uniref:RNase adapter RapZ n=1 Tax=Candidatus Ignatzschineria merdigallinarum TaxID=2838621 RepID=A0A9D1TTE1_9GAMM|nr:RNase adapter RapZ [Candidatus Ignatzschineria merdigallinarum]
MQQMIIISGLSGSGKSIALQTLEDEGFFCIDNLPITFIPRFIEEIQQRQGISRLAIGVDARSFPEDLAEAESIFDQIEACTSLKPKILFLDANDDVLIKRYSHTRRRHPLSSTEKSLTDAINYERELLSPLRLRANVLVDTSFLNVHELRSILKQRLIENSKNSLFINIISFGYRNGVPLDADFVFDARMLTNPHWIPHLREYTGLDTEITNFFADTEDIQEFYNDIATFITKWLPTFKKGTRSYLTIAIGCTGGKHRSVYLAQRLFELLQADNNVLVKHREINI